MRVGFVAASPNEYIGICSESAVDRRRLAALIPYWEEQGVKVAPWNPRDIFDVIYCVSVQQSQEQCRRILGQRRQRRSAALVVGLVEDAYFGHFATRYSSDPIELAKREIRNTKDILRVVRDGFAGIGLIRSRKQEVLNIIKEADAVVTTSAGQATLVRQTNLRVLDIADPMPHSDFKGRHCEYPLSRSPIRIVWEGTNWGLSLVEHVRPALERLARRVSIEFVFIGPRYRPDTFHGTKDNAEILKTYGFPTQHIEWRLANIGASLSSCDIGIAPMLIGNPFYANKAFSKPLSYMTVGMPVVASGIPSYRELITNGVNGYLANTIDEWSGALGALSESSILRRAIGMEGQRRATSYHSVEIAANKMLKVFDNAVRWRSQRSKALRGLRP